MAHMNHENIEVRALKSWWPWTPECPAECETSECPLRKDVLQGLNVQGLIGLNITKNSQKYADASIAFR